MSRRSRKRGPSREVTYWTLCGVFVLVGALLAVHASAPQDQPRRLLTPTTGSGATTTARVRVATPVGADVRHSWPRRLIVPSLGISTSVGPLGLQSDHQVQVPTSVHTVGWFRLGPTPGQIGSSVILGHVDSYLGPGVFFNIKRLGVGALIEVVLDDGDTVRFRVLEVVQYAKSHFPDALVYGTSGARLLNLVTCGGTFDHTTGSYESNIVVFSRLVGVDAAT